MGINIDELTDKELDSNILDDMTERPGYSFADLEHTFPTNNPRKQEAMYFIKDYNLIMWVTTNTRLFDSLNRLEKSKKIFARGASLFYYAVDGMALNLPIAKSVRKYKKDTWIPMVWEIYEKRKKFLDSGHKEYHLSDRS